VILREYQQNIVAEAVNILQSRKVVYLALAMRVGKTLTSLVIAKELEVESVLFVTKLKAIEGIQSDADLVSLDGLEIVNYESLHKCKKEYDLLIVDEAHNCLLGKTLIDGVKIKDIKTGSFQKSFNFEKGIFEYKKVLNVFKNKLSENLVKIKCNGKEIVCTESHKIFTRRGWIRAGDILPEDELQVV
jgi:hypothetical protein